MHIENINFNQMVWHLLLYFRKEKKQLDNP